MMSSKPFKGWTSGACRVAVHRFLSDLYDGGKTSRRFSPHDLRHAMAIREYEVDNDLMRVMRLLGHSSVATTQTYLEGLGILQGGL